MSKIRQLSDEVCNKIAAGEVVERPASIVKELVENSLDAGARKITVTIEDGGRRSISVADDGEGMDADDALLCLDPHSTSKISSEADIFDIASFGFRGEAIPSIAAVTRLTIRTRRRETPEGVEVFIADGKAVSEKPAGCPPGTEVCARDLFFNVPARKNFLRTVATEERHIVEILSNIALAHHDVAFILKADGRILLSTPSAPSILPRISEFFGREYAGALLPFSRTERGITVNGFIARRGFTRNSRAEQRIFVNARPVESAPVYRAIKEACGPMLERGRFQPALIYLSMPPGSVDVNVHPTKREVRFRNEFDVIAAVRTAVSAALRTNDAVIPVTAEGVNDPAETASRLFPDFSPDMQAQDGPFERPEINKSSVEDAPVPASGIVTSVDSLLESARVGYRVLGPMLHAPFGNAQPPQNTSCASEPQSEDAELPIPPEQLRDPSENEPRPDFRLVAEDAPATDFGGTGLRLLGVLENSYIVAAIPGGLVLIDQHAAHERVLFERILNGIDGTLSQKLLMPITIELSPADMAYVARNLHEFENIGFEIEPFGRNTVKLNSIPAAIKQENVGGFFHDMLARIGEIGAGQRLATDTLARAACKAAVKAHDRLSLQEAAALIEQMSHCALPYSCPHGRPTMLNISISEIERRFGRK
ncbi:MAG: DNA mismatch repair endonuclease MutL [Lentisphaeria bacterium]|nr:DNA mismatch repair endonuclease MutL [Lentisphaeria bacterium]